MRRASVDSATLLRTLQQENDTLRDQLLQTQSERDRLARQLESLSASAATALATEKHTASSSTRQVEALRQRCEQLADRLLGSVREHQLSQTSEVFFLLRTQQEERRSVVDGLEGLLEEMGLEDPPTRAERRRQMYEGNGGDKGVAALHPGTVSRLLMLVADGLQQRSAAIKLEQARVLLALEQTRELVPELQQALEQATRCVFECARALEEGGAPPPLEMLAASPQGDSILSHMLDSALGRTAAGARGGSSSVAPPPLPANVVVELDWSCDAMKAAFRGLAELVRQIEGARRALATPTTLTAAATAAAPPAGESLVPLGVSPEVEGLLRSLVQQLQAMQGRSQRQQDQLARRLSHEMQCHYESAKQYEQRVRLLEEENMRLLTSSSTQQWGGLSSSSAAASARATPTLPAEEPVVAYPSAAARSPPREPYVAVVERPARPPTTAPDTAAAPPTGTALPPSVFDTRTRHSRTAAASSHVYGPGTPERQRGTPRASQVVAYDASSSGGDGEAEEEPEDVRELLRGREGNRSRMKERERERPFTPPAARKLPMERRAEEDTPTGDTATFPYQEQPPEKSVWRTPNERRRERERGGRARPQPQPQRQPYSPTPRVPPQQRRRRSSLEIPTPERPYVPRERSRSPRERPLLSPAR